MEDELEDAGAVAQVDEDQPAVVAAPVHPAGHPGLVANAVAEHLATPGVAEAVRLERGKPIRLERQRRSGAERKGLVQDVVGCIAHKRLPTVLMPLPRLS